MVSPARIALLRAEQRLVGRLAELEAQLDAGDATAWPAYCETAAALAALAPLTSPGADGRTLTTRELAAAFSLTPKVARRKGLKGELPLVPIRLGPGGRAKLRWAAR
jgi:hypothetical protein